MRALVALALPAAIIACSKGEVPPSSLDHGIRDRGVIDAGPDQLARPDVGRLDVSTPDLLPSPDSVGCGNGTVDPGETCDKAITAGNPGACPSSCDDGNPCTTDSGDGTLADCSATCQHTPLANCCGNATVEGNEECDDGNVIDVDGCGSDCKLPGGHLLITEIAVSPTEAEFIEIFNPAAATLPLDQIYLTDRADYYELPAGGMPGVGTDFVVRFPAGATLQPGAYAVIALDGQKFQAAYGLTPDYEIHAQNPSVPDMVAAASNLLGGSAGLTDAGEMALLFSWDGATDLVADVDYVVWEGSSVTWVTKTFATCIDGPDTDTTPTCYKNDTPAISQRSLKPPQSGGSLHRCNYLEDGELDSGGNGLLGHDETSEPLGSPGACWKRNPSTTADRTPGASAPSGLCPQ